MAFVSYDTILGEVDLSIVDTAGPGPFTIGGAAGRMSVYNGELRGYDVNLGGGVFVYAAFGASISAGQVVKLDQSLVSGQVISTAQLWDGTANTGRALAVAVANGVSGQYGWFQVQGNAIIAISGAVSANTPVYWQANGTVSATGVAGKQMENAQFATAGAVTIGSGTSAVILPSSRAVAFLQYPGAQGAIT
ncbi:hypothetical protein ISN75_06835 [Dyella marensis]|uniref:hypothetical protein n=1 Tax=Dyella marensis TaxID=500610 RepID=UPI0031DAC264